MKRSRTRYIAALISLGVCLCILGIGLIIGGSLSFKKCEKESAKNQEQQTRHGNGRCDLSHEAVRVDLEEEIWHVMDVVYSLYPNKIIWHAHAQGDDLKHFRPYNCSPAALKERTNLAAQLYGDAKELRTRINESELKPRELKALIQLLHFLKSDFGQPYGENYYSGRYINQSHNDIIFIKEYFEKILWPYVHEVVYCRKC